MVCLKEMKLRLLGVYLLGSVRVVGGLLILGNGKRK